MAKLILEELEELDSLEITPEEADLIINGEEVGLDSTPSLNDSEKEIYQSSIVTDLLTKELDTFNILKNYLSDTQLDENLEIILESICDDTSIIIGKLQQCLKEAVDENTEELINQGEEASITDTEEELKEE